MVLPKMMMKKKKKEKEIMISSNKKTTMMDIPNDVIIKIFSILPVQSLLLFRLVCKSWFNLIRDSSFVNMQLKNNILHTSNNNPLVLICRYTMGQIEFNSYNIMDTDDDDHALQCPKSLVSVKMPSVTTLRYSIRILGSSNGLVCIMSAGSNTYVCKTYFICNPCTKEYKQVDHIDIAIANDGACVGSRYGFGYDSTIDDYRLVVSLVTAIRVHDNGARETCIYVYTLGTNSWKTIRSSYQFLLYRSGTPDGVVLSGHFYYMARKKSHIRFDIIVSFDFAKEEYRQIAIPDGISDLVRKLGELNGCLCLVSSRTAVGFVDIVEVWMMRHNVENNIYVKEEYTWEKLCTISLESDCLANRCQRSLSPKLLRICKNGKILMVKEWSYKKEIVLYDPKSGQITSLREVLILQNVENYMENLVSLNSGTYMM